MASWKTAVECKEEKNVEKHATCCHWRIGEYQLNISAKWDDRQHLSSSWCHWSQTAACLFSLQQHASEIELLPWVYRNKYYCCAWRNKTKKMKRQWKSRTINLRVLFPQFIIKYFVFLPYKHECAQSTKGFRPTEAECVLLIWPLSTRPQSNNSQEITGNIAQHVNSVALDCERSRQVTT